METEGRRQELRCEEHGCSSRRLPVLPGRTVSHGGWPLGLGIVALMVCKQKDFAVHAGPLDGREVAWDWGRDAQRRFYRPPSGSR